MDDLNDTSDFTSAAATGAETDYYLTHHRRRRQCSRAPVPPPPAPVAAGNVNSQVSAVCPWTMSQIRTRETGGDGDVLFGSIPFRDVCVDDMPDDVSLDICAAPRKHNSKFDMILPPGTVCVILLKSVSTTEPGTLLQTITSSNDNIFKRQHLQTITSSNDNIALAARQFCVALTTGTLSSFFSRGSKHVNRT